MEALKADYYHIVFIYLKHIKEDKFLYIYALNSYLLRAQVELRWHILLSASYLSNYRVLLPCTYLP
jgi:hypothetical protein